MRRLKTDKSIISDLPDKMEITEHVDLSKRQIVLYRKEVEKAEELILESDGMERRGIVLGLLTRLKQICNHPDQFIHDTNFNPKDSGKYAMLKKLCETIYEKRERVLVFTQYKEMCEPLSDYLESIFHKKGYIIHGGIPAKKRTEIVEKFNNEDEYVPYIVLSLKAAGTGLNLTAANHVIHFDRWWNPAVENQASDRAYRIGQTKEVFVHKLVSNGTIEEKINQIIESKQELAESILATGQKNGLLKWIQKNYWIYSDWMCSNGKILETSMQYSQISVEELQRKALQSVNNAKSKGKELHPIIIEGRQVAKSWWGIAWCQNIEQYADYSSRLARGKDMSKQVP